MYFFFFPLSYPDFITVVLTTEAKEKIKIYIYIMSSVIAALCNPGYY